MSLCLELAINEIKDVPGEQQQSRHSSFSDVKLCCYQAQNLQLPVKKKHIR